MPRCPLLTGLVIAMLPASAAMAQTLATGTLVHADGTAAGTARIVEGRGGIALKLRLKGIPEGQHGVHLHTTGACEAPAFTSAGGHLNPGKRQHGANNPAGSHLGDLPNVTADRYGRVKARIPLNETAPALTAALFDADGAAIVVHAGPDDYLTDPSGNSGGRIACGVLEPR